MKKVIEYTNRVLAGLLALLGFGSCERIIIREIPVEYGTPHATYTVKGKVTDLSTGKPVKGIRAGYAAVPFMDNNAAAELTAVADTTDVDGNFKCTGISFSGIEVVPVYIQDIDGEANGSYAPDTLAVDFRNAVQTGKPNGWYNGEYTVTVQVELKKQDEQPAHE